MTTSEVTIFNWALASVGTTSRVQAITESSKEAEACNLWYESVRDQILRSAPWDCASSYKRLAVGSEASDEAAWVSVDPAPGWRFAYNLPADFLYPRYLTSFARFELGTTDTDLRVLYTNEAEAILRYTKRQTRVDLWESDLQAAVGFALGAHICMKLTGSENKVRLVTAQAIDKILAARQTAANAPNVQYEGTPEWLVARGYGGLTPAIPFIYPFGEFTYAGLSSGIK